MTQTLCHSNQTKRGRLRRGLVCALLMGLAATGCSGPDEVLEDPPAMHTMPGLPDLAVMQPAVDPPSCTDCAEAKYPDLAAFFERSLHRTCSPNFGVCHSSRQQPDISTLAGFVGAINQRCNGLRDDPSTIDNLCEPPGDVLRITNGSTPFETPIAATALLPAGATPSTATHLQITLRRTVAERFPPSSTLALVRRVEGLPDIVLALPGNVLAGAIDLGKREVLLTAALLRAQLPISGTRLTWLGFFAPEKYIPGSSLAVVLADPNQDGVYGAELGGLQIKPGDPAHSYLFLRLLAPLEAPGMLTNTRPKAPTLESQMPLANFDYWDLRNAAHAMYCWIKGLSPTGDNAFAPIDYRRCGALPAELIPRPQGGEAETWSAIHSKILRPQCATVGCHDAQTKAAALDLSDLHKAHVALWNQPSTQNRDPEVRLIYPQNPDQSYLVQKLRGTADPRLGARMPLGRELPDRTRAIDALVTWINQGARNN